MRGEATLTDQGQPEPGAPPLEPEPGPALATAAELRRTRRWLAVAGAWAVAASIVALLALLIAADPGQDEPASAAQVRELSDRVDRLEERLASTADAQAQQEADLRDVGQRVGRLEGSVSSLRSADRRSRKELQGLTGRIDSLNRRVESLESAPAEPTTDGGQAPSDTGTDAPP